MTYAVTSAETADSPTTLTQKLTVIDAPTATFSEYMSISIFSDGSYNKDFTVSNSSNATGSLQYIDNGVTNASGHRQYVLLLSKFANYTASPTLTNGQLKMDYDSSSGNGTATLSSITDLGFVGPNGEEAVLVDVDFDDSFNGNLTFYANDIVIAQASDPYNYTQLADGNGGALFYDVSDVKNTYGWGGVTNLTLLNGTTYENANYGPTSDRYTIAVNSIFGMTAGIKNASSSSYNTNGAQADVTPAQFTYIIGGGNEMATTPARW